MKTSSITTTITLLGVLALIACGHQDAKEAAATAVQVAQVREVDGAGQLRYSASVEPDIQVSVAFRVSGYIDSVLVEEGDQVVRGATLARLRKSDYVEKLGQATASEAEAKAALEQATADLARAQRLFAEGALTKPELDGAVASYEVNRARSNRGHSAANEAGIALDDTVLKAPANGVILRRNIETGDLAQPGATAFVLADTRIVKVVFGAPDTMIAGLRKDQTIDVRTESLPDRVFHGTVSRIAPSADHKTRSFDVEVHIDNSSNVLKPGMVASLELAPHTEAHLAIPLDAIVRSRSSDHYAVFVIEDGKAIARDVELGEPIGNLVALQSGLSEGEKVIVSGPALLVDGQPVRVVEGGSHE